MIVVEKLKLNKFRQVSIPKNRDLFVRIGPRAIPPITDSQVASFPNGTMEAISATEDYFTHQDDLNKSK